LLALDEAFPEKDWRIEDSYKLKDPFAEPDLFLGEFFLESSKPVIPYFFADAEVQVRLTMVFGKRLIGKRHWNTVILVLSEEKLNRFSPNDLQKIIEHLR